MAETADQPSASITEDLACCVCRYNLRGLQGETISCPECGSAYRAAMVFSGDPNLPWWRAPRLRGYLLLAVIFAIGYGWGSWDHAHIGMTTAPPVGLVVIAPICLLTFIVGAVRVSKRLSVNVATTLIAQVFFIGLMLVFTAVLAVPPVAAGNNSGFAVLTPQWLILKGLVSFPLLVVIAADLLLIRLLARSCLRHSLLEQALIKA